MRSPLQEKFQLVIPQSLEAIEEGTNSWVDMQTSRHQRGNHNHCVPQFRSTWSAEEDGSKFNYMPPGMELDNQVSAEIKQMPLVMSGQTDVSADTNPQAFEHGFRRQEFTGTDDQYTGEHVDQFYGVALGKDDTEQTYEGFVERNNYLDRM